VSGQHGNTLPHKGSASCARCAPTSWNRPSEDWSGSWAPESGSRRSVSSLS